MKKYSLLKTLPLIAILLLASCAKKFTIEEADKAYKDKAYARAANMYDQIYKDKNTARNLKSEIAFKSGESYRNFENYEKAIRSYDKALDRDKNNAQALYMKGVVLQNQGKYKEAIKVFNSYLKIYPGDKDAIVKKKGCELALSWKDDCTRYEVENFKIANTRDNEYSPMVADKKDGSMFFTSDRNPDPKKREKLYEWTGNGFHDIWQISEQKSKRRKRSSSATTEKKWDRPTHLENPPNTKANDGTLCFNRRFNVMYYTICNGGDNKSPACKIYESKKIGTEWTEPVMLSFCEGDSLSSYGHPTLSDDGKKLYFSSNRAGGLGGHDLWVVNYVRRGRTWSEPVNLGPTVNTSKNEMFPYLNNHDKKLYFSSNGHPGFGALDMYTTEGAGEEWSTPENLSIPMNSGGDDFGITFDNNNPLHGFFSSNRDGGKGGDDIYEFVKIPPIIDIKGIVIDSTTKKPLPGSLVTITWNDTNKIKIITDEQGAYFTELAENQIYTIQATNDTNYYFPSRIATVSTFDIKCDTHFVENFQLKSMIEVWELPIFYDLNKANIRPDAARVLDQFAKEVLLEYPRIVVEMGSHTDCRSSFDYNMDLSRRRADSAVAYLVKKGIMKQRLFAKGYGESQLTNECECEGAKVVPCSEAEHQKNRRTTIKIVNFNFDPRNKTVIGGNPLNDNFDGNRNDSAYIADSATLAREKFMKDSADAFLAKQTAAAKKLDSLSVKLKITEDGGVKTVPIKVNETEDVQFTWNMKSSRTSIPISLAEKWMKSELINKGDFLDGDKIKGPDGTKMPSNRFKIKSLDVGGYVLTNVTVYILGDDTKPVLGKTVFRKFDPTKIREEKGTLMLLPKRR